MPSKSEPCGLSQMVALRYGTIPIVRETGGLKDTVIPYNQYTGEGTGFSFANFNAYELADTVRRALALYHNKHDAYLRVQRQAMARVAGCGRQCACWPYSCHLFCWLWGCLHSGNRCAGTRRCGRRCRA